MQPISCRQIDQLICAALVGASGGGICGRPGLQPVSVSSTVLIRQPVKKRLTNSRPSSKCAAQETPLSFTSFINFDNISRRKNIELQVLKDQLKR